MPLVFCHSTSTTTLEIDVYIWRYALVLVHARNALQAHREEGKGGKVFPGPATFGGPPSLKNTENGVPDGFFLT